ncbi:hypothetical protein Tco_1225973 [Tanacetum coccineum]
MAREGSASNDSGNLTEAIISEGLISSEYHLEPTVEDKIRVTCPIKSGELRRIVEADVETLKTEHPPRREAPRIHKYKDPSESQRLYKESVHGKKAINEEMVSLEKNKTWSLVRLPAAKKALQSKWVFRVKEEQDDRKRAINVQDDLLIGDIDEDIYMTQPEVFCLAGKRRKSCVKVKNVCIDFKQDQEQWYLKLQFYAVGLVQRDMLWYSMDAEARCQPLGDHFKLSKKQAPKTEAYRRRISMVSYALAVDSVMCAMKRGFDLDYEGCLDSGKITTGYVFTVGGTTVSWMSRIQKCVAMSTTEAEYMSAIHLAKNTVFHGRTKHIKIRYHYIRELVSEGTLSLKNILGGKNPADMLTKVVTTEKLKLCAASTGLRDN